VHLLNRPAQAFFSLEHEPAGDDRGQLLCGCRLHALSREAKHLKEFSLESRPGLLPVVDRADASQTGLFNAASFALEKAGQSPVSGLGVQFFCGCRRAAGGKLHAACGSQPAQPEYQYQRPWHTPILPA